MQAYKYLLHGEISSKTILPQLDEHASQTIVDFQRVHHCTLVGDLVSSLLGSDLVYFYVNQVTVRHALLPSLTAGFAQKEVVTTWFHCFTRSSVQLCFHHWC
jgi:hypothetical protein